VQLIYLDTTIWNVLAQQTPDEEKLCRDLSNANTRLTLGLNAFHELLRTFYGTRPDAKSRGKRLFTCLRRFLARSVPLLKTWEQLLVEEADNIYSSVVSISPLEDDPQLLAKIANATRELSSGSLGPQLQDIVDSRKAVNETVGKLAARQTLEQEGMTTWLRSVQPEQLTAYLDQESVGETGQNLLVKYLTSILQQFGRTLRLTPSELASVLLSNPRNKTSRAVVRSDIYRSWEFARNDRSAFRPCIPDDSYHVANASYCQFFVTEDRDGQAEAAKRAVSNIRVLLYEREEAKFADWLPQAVSAVT
jgi:hypothetical protein